MSCKFIFFGMFFNDVVLAGKASRVNDCGQRFNEASRAGEACGQNSATCPLHQRVLLQHMQARLQHGARHGHARAPWASFAARQFDRRPLAQDHRRHQAQKTGAGMDVVHMECAENAENRTQRSLIFRSVVRGAVQVRQSRFIATQLRCRRLDVPAREVRRSSVVAGELW